MTEKMDADELLLEACRENRESLLSCGPDFDKIEKVALEKLMKRRGLRRRKTWVRAVAAVAAAFILLNGAILLTEIPEAKAYRNNVRKLFFNLVNGGDTYEMQVVSTSQEIENAQEKVPFQIPFPHWLPEGYTLEEITVDHDGYDSYVITMKYNSDTMALSDKLIFTIENDPGIADTLPSKGESVYEKHNLSGFDVYTQKIETEKYTRLKGVYTNDQGLLIRITGRIDMQTLSQLIHEMKP